MRFLCRDVAPLHTTIEKTITESVGWVSSMQLWPQVLTNFTDYGKEQGVLKI